MTNIETLRAADWEKLEAEVVEKIHVLKAIAHGLEPSPLHDKIAADLILPCLEMLGHFCMSVTEEPEAGDERN